MDWASQGGPALVIAAGVASPLLGIIYFLLRERITELKADNKELKSLVEKSVENNKTTADVLKLMGTRVDEVLVELKEARRREVRA